MLKIIYQNVFIKKTFIIYQFIFVLIFKSMYNKEIKNSSNNIKHKALNILHFPIFFFCYAATKNL